MTRIKPSSLSLLAVVLAVVLVLPLARSASAQSTPSRVVVWVRPASSEELQLTPKSQPALRKMAREGVSLKRVVRADRASIVSAIRDLGTQLGTTKFNELGASKKAAKDDPLAELVGRFGKPPPVSQGDVEAINRLRGGKSGGSKKITVAGGDDKATRALVRKLSTGVADAIEGGARVILQVDNSAPVTDDDIRVADAKLATLSDALGVFGSRGSTMLMVVLVPQGGRPTILVAGAGVRKARVSTTSVDTSDLAAGLSWIAGRADKSSDAARTWLAGALEQPVLQSVVASGK